MHVKTIQKSSIVALERQESPIVKNKLEKKWVKLKVIWELLQIAAKKSKSPSRLYKIVRSIKQNFKDVQGEALITKVAKVNNRYYWRMASPGFPSSALHKMHENEINRLFPESKDLGMRTIIFAVTKKCALNCEHCFEWERLNSQEELSLSDIIQTIHKYQDFGTVQIMLSGGEPMLRINDMYALLKQVKTKTDFWIITSGLGLNRFRANRLKNLGLTGVLISLDHYIPELHNQFRGFEGSFEAATSAALQAKQAGLVTALSLCTTQEFTTEANLRSYMDLARKLGVSFVQFLEPRATGRYGGKNVELSSDQFEMLDRIFLEYNRGIRYPDYPIINYLGYHQRRMGCFGGGNRFFYIDSDGDAHICPFCSDKIANVRDHSAEDMVSILRKNACHSFDENHSI